MGRLPSLPVVILIALTSTLIAVSAQGLVGKSAWTVGIGPITAVLMVFGFLTLKKNQR